MRSLGLALFLTLIGGITLAAPSIGPKDETRMDRLMALKTAQRDAQRAAGLFAPKRFAAASSNGFSPCVNGKAAGEYACKDVDLHGFLGHGEMGSATGEGNDVWGWTSDGGREFGAVGQTDGTAFVEVLGDGSLVYLGRLPTATTTSIWRDMKVVDGFVYIGAEAKGHGVQVFDMRKLISINPTSPKTFKAADLTAYYTGFGTSHNIVAHPETSMIYAVGTARTSACKGGLYMLDVSTPSSPKYAGCASADGYVHDAQCVLYQGPDARYVGREVCFGYNEDTLTIYDLTTRSAPKILSKNPYAGSAYTHQGWLTDPHNHTHLLLDDELDEHDRTGVAANGHTTTYIFDISALASPRQTGVYQSPVKAIDHSQYVHRSLSWQANYGSGLRIADVRSIPEDPSGKSMREVGFFDVHPEDDAEGGVVEFFGAWSVFPYFESGFVLVNSIERGVFSVRFTGGGVSE